MNAPTRAEFLARRKAGIGGSDISVVLGLNPYRTPFELWLDKTGRSEPEHSADSLERMYWGTEMEDLVAKRYASEHGIKVQRINSLMQHPDCPIALANVDRVVLNDGTHARWTGEQVKGARAVLECKTAHALALNSPDWGDAGTDQVPMHYFMQCMWYLGITGLPYADLAVLFGGQKFQTYTIGFERELFQDMLQAADEWWTRHIINDLPPDPQSEAEARQRWSVSHPGKDLIVSADVAAAVDQLGKIKREIKRYEEEEQRLKDLILPAFGDAESISYLGRKLATWKQNKPSSKTDWKATACELGDRLDPEIFALVRDAHTTETPGARVLRLTAAKE